MDQPWHAREIWCLILKSTTSSSDSSVFAKNHVAVARTEAIGFVQIKYKTTVVLVVLNERSLLLQSGEARASISALENFK